MPTSSDKIPQKDIDWFSDVFLEHRERLVHIVQMHMNATLFQRFNAEDITQEVFLAGIKRIAYLKTNPEVPMFVKLRSLALQTLVDVERKYLKCQKRDASKDVNVDAPLPDKPSQNLWNILPNAVTSPRTQLAKEDRYVLLHQALEELSETDQEILKLRHFEELSNIEVAVILNIEVKAASIRYVRAIKRFQDCLLQYTEFHR